MSRVQKCWTLRAAEVALILILAAIIGVRINGVARSWPDLRRRHVSARLDRLMPRFAYLAAFVTGHPDPEPALLAEGRHYYDTVLRYYPDFVDALSLRAFLTYLLGDVDGARQAYGRVLAKDAGHFSAHYNLGLLDFFDGQWPAAEEHFAAIVDRRLAEGLPEMSFLENQLFLALPSRASLGREISQRLFNVSLLLAVCRGAQGDESSLAALVRQAGSAGTTLPPWLPCLEGAARIGHSPLPVWLESCPRGMPVTARAEALLQEASSAKSEQRRRLHREAQKQYLAALQELLKPQLSLRIF